MFKEKTIEHYKKFINSIIIDEEIRNELIEKIDYFESFGKIKIEKNNLYGQIKKAINAKNEYIEIRFENNYFICNYTDWYNQKYVNITQKKLKDNNIKIDKKEKIEYICSNNENKTSIEEIELIYNSDKKLAYKSSIEKDIQYNIHKDSIDYSDNIFTNNFSLDKKWYLKNGSIINYYLSKNYVYKDCKLEESYRICPQAVFDGYNYNYVFMELDKELFKKFMTGKITEYELIENLDKNVYENEQKIKLVLTNG